VPLVYPDPQPIEILYATVSKTGTANGEVDLEWLPSRSTDIYVAGYHLYAANNPAGPFTLIHTETNLATTTFTYKNINTKTRDYFFYITPYNICAKEDPGSGVHHVINLNVTNFSLNAFLSWNTYKGFAVDHYEIEKSIDGSPLITTYKSSAIDTTYADTNVLCGHVYAYRILAVNNDGLRSWSDSVRIVAYDNVPPRQADIYDATVFSTSSTAGQIMIDFRGANDKNRRGYIIYRSVNSAPYTFIDTFKITGTGTLQYVDNKLDTRNKNYAYYVRSFDSCGNVAVSSDTHQVVLLHVTAQNAYNKLSWNHYKGFGSWSYTVERRSSGMPLKQVSTSAYHAYDDYKVKCDTLYEYRIRTTELTSSYTSYSNTDTVTSYEINKPNVPDITRGSVATTNTTGGTISVIWQASNSPDLKRYLIYRKSDTNPWILVGTVPVGTLSFTDVGLNTYRKTYLYKVLTEDSCRNVSQDNSEIHRPVNLVATPGNEQIDLNWTEYLGFTVKKYEIYRDNILLDTVPPTTFMYTDSNLYCTKDYVYMVKAIADDGTVSFSNTDKQRPSDSRPPKRVYVVTATF
jgi:hypothetical protein